MTATPWWRLRLRLNNRTITIEQYTELEPNLTRPLTDDPIRRRNIARKPAPKESVR
jgi:hypothetical protein